uniref:Uncharacterized protein n=1 Tax=viral metagenome TaxID=1070528 RepID=A0A6C0JYM0_9ZZZZ
MENQSITSSPPDITSWIAPTIVCCGCEEKGHMPFMVNRRRRLLLNSSGKLIPTCPQTIADHERICGGPLDPTEYVPVSVRRSLSSYQKGVERGRLMVAYDKALLEKAQKEKK